MGAFQIVANWVAPTGQKAYFVFMGYKAVAHTGQCLWFFLTLFIIFLAMRQFEMHLSDFCAPLTNLRYFRKPENLV
jgi:hypothetical protein